MYLSHQTLDDCSLWLLLHTPLSTPSRKDYSHTTTTAEHPARVCLSAPRKDETTYEPSFAVERLTDWPQSVAGAVAALQDESRTDLDLYNAADIIVEWLEDSAELSQRGKQLLAILHCLPTRSLGVLFGALADSEIQLDYLALLLKASEFLYSCDGRLAQMAAAFLWVCGGDFGKSAVVQAVKMSAANATLIRGLVQLMDRSCEF